MKELAKFTIFAINERGEYLKSRETEGEKGGRREEGKTEGWLVGCDDG